METKVGNIKKLECFMLESLGSKVCVLVGKFRVELEKFPYEQMTTY